MAMIKEVREEWGVFHDRQVRVFETAEQAYGISCQYGGKVLVRKVTVYRTKWQKPPT